MAIFFSTTGTQDPVIFNDLGARQFSHPTVNFEITLEYSPEELAQSSNFQNAIDSGYITVEDEQGNPITEIVAISGGDMSTEIYDPDKDGIVNKANALNDGSTGGGIEATATEVRTHIDDLSNPHSVNAGQTSFTPPSGMVATDVQAAIEELNVASSDDQTATEVPFIPDGDITSTDVQAAIVEVRDDTDTKLSGKANTSHTHVASEINDTSNSGQNVQNHIDNMINPHNVIASQISYTPISGSTIESTNVQDAIDELESEGGAGGQSNTASNVGVGGVGPFKQKSGVDLEFKNINAGSNRVIVTDDTGNNEIDIDINVHNDIVISIRRDTEPHVRAGNNTSYTVDYAFYFRGTVDLGIPNNIKVVVQDDASSSKFDVRIFDITNSLVIAEKLDIEPGSIPINIDLGTLSNLPTGEAVWEVQSKKSVVAGDRGKMYGITVKF